MSYKSKVDEKEHKKVYYQLHKEEIKEKSRKYRAAHAEQIKETRKFYYQKNKEKVKKNVKKYTDGHKTAIQIYNNNYRETHMKTLREYKKNWSANNNKYLKIRAMEMIANFHGSKIKCWRCGELRIWVLTIGHLNGDGTKDRKINGRGMTYYKKIISGKRSCEDLQIECVNCNCCLQWYGKYPDEINEEDWNLVNKQIGGE